MSIEEDSRAELYLHIEKMLKRVHHADVESYEVMPNGHPLDKIQIDKRIKYSLPDPTPASKIDTERRIVFTYCLLEVDTAKNHKPMQIELSELEKKVKEGTDLLIGELGKHGIKCEPSEIKFCLQTEIH